MQQLKSPCGWYQSQSGKSWTPASLAQHVKDCPDCQKILTEKGAMEHDKPLVARCGATVTGKGNPFTFETLVQHQQTCHKCNPSLKVKHAKRKRLWEHGKNDLWNSLEDELATINDEEMDELYG